MVRSHRVSKTYFIIPIQNGVLSSLQLGYIGTSLM